MLIIEHSCNGEARQTHGAYDVSRECCLDARRFSLRGTFFCTPEAAPKLLPLRAPAAFIFETTLPKAALPPSAKLQKHDKVRRRADSKRKMIV